MSESLRAFCARRARELRAEGGDAERGAAIALEEIARWCDVQAQAGPMSVAEWGDLMAGKDPADGST